VRAHVEPALLEMEIDSRELSAFFRWNPEWFWQVTYCIIHLLEHTSLRTVISAKREKVHDDAAFGLHRNSVGRGSWEANSLFDGV